MPKRRGKTKRKRKGGAAFNHYSPNNNFGPPGHRPKGINQSKTGRTRRHSLRRLRKMKEAEIPFNSNSNEFDPDNYAWELNRLGYGSPKNHSPKK